MEGKRKHCIGAFTILQALEKEWKAKEKLVSGGEAKVTIYNGNFVGMNGMVSGNATVYGGTFSTVWDYNHYDLIEAVVAEGYKAIEVDGKYVVVPENTTKIEINDTTDYETVNSTINEALANGGSIILAGNVKTESNVTAPYGNKVAVIQNGGVIDGNGNTLTIDCYGDDYGIMTSGGTIKNITIEDVARGIVLMSPTEDVILDNVTLKKGLLYPINTTEHATVEGVDLIVSESTFGGWSSFAGIDSASFTDCHFVNGNYGYGWPYDCLIKPYISTTFTSCDFAEKAYLDLSALGADCKVTFVNCTVDGVALTADSCGFECDGTESFCVELPSGRALADCVVFE